MNRTCPIACAVATLAFSGALAAARTPPVPQSVSSSLENAPAVAVEILEDVPAGKELEPLELAPTASYTEPAYAFPALPTSYSVNALPLDRSVPFVLRAGFERSFPPGQYQVRLRARGASRLLLDGRPLLTTGPQKANTTGDDPVPPPIVRDGTPLRPAPHGHQDLTASLTLDAAPHRFTLQAVIGGKGLIPTPGELCVSIGRKGEVPRLLGPDSAPLLTDEAWERHAAEAAARHRSADVAARRELSRGVVASWEERHRKVREWLSGSPSPKLPALPPGATVRTPVDRFIASRLGARGRKPTAPLSDLAFLRRLSLDTTGLIPTPAEIRAYLADPAAARRQRAVDRYLASPGWADHWVSYWQDVLAENPGILKPDLNNTGPFRWWLHQSFTDNLPFDRLASELVEMGGSSYQGGPAAFGQATLNDSPMAAKGHILAQAFLAQNLACARCHDAPGHPFKQRDLFSLAAMLDGKPVSVPQTSTVRLVEGFRKPNVTVTLHPGEPVAPEWPFPDLAPREPAVGIPAQTKVASRARLAAVLVAPENERFAQVLVNRVWKRYLGQGLVEPADDWLNAVPSHPELLRYLAREFVAGGYDLKRLARLILTSDAYQRRPAASAGEAPEERLFAGPYRRRLTAEQLVDSLHRAAGKQLATEPLNLNPMGDRPLSQFLDLGCPGRAWEFTALSNERDRPALALPRSQAVIDVLTTYGWRQSRQNPVTVRDDAPSPMQTLILANGSMGARIVRLSDDSAVTELFLEGRPLPQLVRELFLRVLSRPPSQNEAAATEAYLRPFFAGRVVKGARKQISAFRSDPRVSWSNHLSAEATVIRMEEERRLRLGDQPTGRLTAGFRERAEDVLWALVNSPEFVMVP